MRFRYRAIAPDGRIIRGSMDAADRATVIQKIQREGLRVTRADEQPAGRSFPGISATFTGRPGLSQREVGEITRELAIMLGAGQDLDRALRFLLETVTKERQRAVLQDIRERLRNGATFSASLQAQRSGFSRLYIGLVRAGEASGTLAATLKHLATLLERQRNLVTTVQSALIYPAILVVLALASIIFLLTYVLPQFTPIFEEAGAQLPSSTRFLIALGQLTTDQGLWILVALAASAFAISSASSRPASRRLIDRILLHIPVVAGLIRQLEAARLTRTLGTLLMNGVGLVGALSIAHDVATNSLAIEGIERASASVKAGTGLARALSGSRIFPTRTIHLLQLGEETGQLAELANRASEIHEEQVRVDVQRLVALLTPAITVVMGMAVAGIVSALLLAMIAMNDVVL